MKKTLVLAAVLFLAGCQTPQVNVQPGTIAALIQLLPQRIKDRVAEQCRWVEPASNIANIIELLGGFQVPGIVDVAAAEICEAVKAKRAGKRMRGGIVLKGHSL